jgi:hypothetical protein
MEVSWNGPRVGQHERLSCLWCRGGARQLGVSPVKLELTGDPGGAFYINEYRDVLVPDTSNGGSVYAGNYTRDLEFDYNGTPITPRPPQGLSPGDPWPGPHVGIRYTLMAGGRDIRYELKSGRTIREHWLSDDVVGSRQTSSPVGSPRLRGTAAEGSTATRRARCSHHSAGRRAAWSTSTSGRWRTARGFTPESVNLGEAPSGGFY